MMLDFLSILSCISRICEIFRLVLVEVDYFPTLFIIIFGFQQK